MTARPTGRTKTMATQAPTETLTAEKELVLTPPDPVPVVTAAEGDRAGAGVGRRKVQAGRKGRWLHRRPGGAGRQLARIRQARRPDHQHGPQGNHARRRASRTAFSIARSRRWTATIRRRRRSRRSCAARSRISIPARRATCSRRKKLFGIIPFGNKMRDYFDSYKVVAGAHPVDPGIAVVAARTSC